MGRKIISIIVPCYNVEKYIDRCFDGIISQTLGIDRMEIIVVDDSSTDGTLDKLKIYEEKYQDSVVLIPLKKNVGQGSARNIALQYATAPYIGFVDSDDTIDSNMFKTMVSVIEENGCDFVECDWDYFSDNRQAYTSSSFKLGDTGFYDFSDFSIKDKYISKQLFFTAVWNKVFRKEFIIDNDISFVEGLRYEDMYFCFLAILYANSYYYLENSFYHYYLNPNGTMQQRKESYQLDVMDVSYAFLETVRKRGLYERYKDEVDWMFIEKYYVYMIWDIWDMYPEQAYDCYLDMKKTVIKLIPDYANNPFRRLEENEMDDMILKLLNLPLSKEQFEDIMDKLWQQQHK